MGFQESESKECRSLLDHNTQYLLVSVIVPVYNASRVIEKLLLSLKENDYPSFEVLFVDDGSTDNSVELIRKHGFEVIVCSENQGQASARNKGIEQARGEIICFFDADVIVHKNTISLLVDSLENNNCDAVSGNYEEESVDTDFFSRYYAYFKTVGHGEKVVTGHNILGTYCCAVRKNILDKVNGFKSFPPGMDIECEAIGWSLSEAGCKFVFDPTISVWHHFGGFVKILYIFSNRVFWFTRYSLIKSGESEKLEMRNTKTSLAVLFSMVSSFSFGISVTNILINRSFSIIALLLLIIGTLFFGISGVLKIDFYRFCAKKQGFWFLLKCLFASELFFTIAGISTICGVLIHIWYKLTRAKDILKEVLES